MYKIGDEVVLIDPPMIGGRYNKGDVFVISKEQWENGGKHPYIRAYPKGKENKPEEERTWYVTRIAPMWKLWMPDMEPLKKGDIVKIGELVDERANGFEDYVGIGAGMRAHIGKTTTVARHWLGNDANQIVELAVDEHEFIWNARWLYVKNVNADAVVIKPAAKWKEGDIVVCVKKIETDDMRFSPKMEKMLAEAKKFAVERVDEKSFVVQGGGWFWPQDCLEKYDMAKHAPKKHKTVTQLKADIRKKAQEEGAGSMASYAVIVKDEKGIPHAITHLTDVCHARLDKESNYDKRDKWDKAVAVLDFFNNGIKRHAKRMPEYKAYLSYIFTRSPWASAFKKKEMKNVLLTGAEYDVSQPAGIIAGAAIAARMAYEYPERLPVFSLVRKHASEEAAWLCFYAFSVNGKNYTLNNMGGGHEVLDGNNMKLDCIISLFANGYPEEAFKAKPYSEVSKYRVFATIGDDTYYDGEKKWNPKYGLAGTFKRYVKDNAKDVVKGKGWAQVSAYDDKAIIEFAKQLDVVINDVRNKAAIKEAA